MNGFIISGLTALAIIVAFVVVAAMVRRAAFPAAVSPVVVTALIVGAILVMTGTPVVRFQHLSAPLHLILGPAIVGLGGGVFSNRRALSAASRPLALAILVGTATGVASAVILGRSLGLGPLLAAATLTRTISTPFAILVQTRTHGPVPLAAGFAVATGAIGAILLPPLLNLFGVRDRVALGTAVGVAAHLVGADAVGRRDALAGSFAGAALVGAGVLVALIVPPLWPWLIG